MLEEAIEAVRRGQSARARDLLTRLLKADSSNPQYWLWMSAVVETLKERVYCLQAVLRLDPGNALAKKGLILAGAASPDERAAPNPPVRRRWETVLQDQPRRRGLAGLVYNPLLRLLFFTLVGLAVIGMVAAGVFGLGRPRPVALAPTKTPGPPPTFTPTPTFLGGRPVPATPTPPAGAVPLWSLLEATYTPTPVYVNTPHAISEAYRAAQRAFSRGDLAAALRYFQQAAQVDPDAADIQYHIGEVQSMLGEPARALEAFDAAVAAAPGFAPAYFGRACARLALGLADEAGFESVEADFEAALAHDSNFGEIYLARAAYWISRGAQDAAHADLLAAEKLLPGSPLLPLYRAQLALQTGDAASAYTLAQEANTLDVTLPETYRTLGQAALVQGDFTEAVKALQVYLQHQEADLPAWLAFGQAQAGLSGPESAGAEFRKKTDVGQLELALEVFARLVDQESLAAEAYLYRGLVYLQSGQGQEAVNDLVQARRLENDRPGGGQSSPLWFSINLALGRALSGTGRNDEATAQLGHALSLAKTAEQQAMAYYWRAQALEALDDPAGAITDWQALLTLPSSSYAPGWRKTAAQHISALATPTPTNTATVTASATATTRATATRTKTATPRPTKTPSPPAYGNVEASATPTP